MSSANLPPGWSSGLHDLRSVTLVITRMPAWGAAGSGDAQEKRGGLRHPTILDRIAGYLYSTTLLIDSTCTLALANSSSMLLRSGALQQQIAWLFSSSMYALSIQRLLPPEAVTTAFHDAIICSVGIFGRVTKNFGITTSCLNIMPFADKSRHIHVRFARADRLCYACEIRNSKHEFQNSKLETGIVALKRNRDLRMLLDSLRSLEER